MICTRSDNLIWCGARWWRTKTLKFHFSLPIFHRTLHPHQAIKYRIGGHKTLSRTGNTRDGKFATTPFGLAGVNCCKPYDPASEVVAVPHARGSSLRHLISLCSFCTLTSPIRPPFCTIDRPGYHNKTHRVEHGSTFPLRLVLYTI